MNLNEKQVFFEIIADGHLLRPKEIFENNQPIRLEIGSGRGEFLIQIAESYPQINFLGMEMKQKRINTILRQLDINKHPNVRILRSFADENITQILPENTFSLIYIFHPDPWPKKRHNRRRLIQQKFIEALWCLLTEEGEIVISTDHNDYAMWIIEQFAESSKFQSVYPEGFSRETPADHFSTYFEIMKRAEGFEPYFFRYKRKIDG
jgi:tRNA (guanine-N7-)-methyltransferase